MQDHYIRANKSKRINGLQRIRRSKLNRIYYADVSPEAKQIIDSLRDGGIDGTASAILNRIVVEWEKIGSGI